MKDKELLLLDHSLKEMHDRNKSFGGFSIMFAGDFRQLEPNAATQYDLLFSSQYSGHWENCINAIIILNNSHRFKDDPEYGKLLKWMWTGELSKKEQELINTRVVGKMDWNCHPHLMVMCFIRVQQTWNKMQYQQLVLKSM